MFFNSHLYQRNLAVVGAQNRISQVVVVVGFFFLLDMSRSPDLLEPHSGSCRGKGLLTRAYHGYVKEDDESAWVERQCDCCSFVCTTCAAWTRAYILRTHRKEVLPVKAPPPFKPPPAKRSLVYNGGYKGPSYFHLNIISINMGVFNICVCRWCELF